MTSNHHLDISNKLGPFLCHFIAFWNFEGNMREIPTWKYPQGFHREKRRKYPHRTFPFISLKFPQGNYEEISTGMIPWNSPINPRGNLGDVDGLPAGPLLQEGTTAEFPAPGSSHNRPCPSYIRVEVNDPTKIQWQTEADSTHDIHKKFFNSIIRFTSQIYQKLKLSVAIKVQCHK